MNYRPIDIAKKLNISTSLLRHYEKYGLFPKPDRSASGYRIYTETSLHFLKAVRTCTLAYGYQMTKEMTALVEKRKYIQLFWLINDAQFKLHQQKHITEQTLALLHEEESHVITHMPKKGWISIGEAAERLSVTETTIRHWSKEGLIQIPRDVESNYRQFDEQALRRLLIIRLIRSSIWSLDTVREILNTFNADTPAELIKLAEQSLQALNKGLERQFIAQNYLYQLITFLTPEYFIDFPGMEF
ncbi:MerR family DNA-binding transcriptional regulator [Enterococcus sp. BWB1-3]|uniref:MerR family transcriptional regulator n=1 Tax=unclassified Enterococcus TaxID=2608891 RepID=UPI001920CFAD|nr:MULTISPECIES: MerR family DNA-binding transcriptional regulator [unclassified Enterococcus]MBL1228840.1 MerR family DNA-binding transcriptional regulator [Enterococcus sp. BWB1-3]MCB5951617.1 MerR family DNA-binding transcriptional regulator [Enterococcus sp. BWT-B8]MCB5954709.1 MerR family DNA-binding transcriptional regulator [Enterococcus sp. CWB-B31]